jgi:mono/diheme cytochrome c family protein
MTPVWPKAKIENAFLLSAVCAAISFALAGCGPMHGHPGPGPDVIRPENELDFASLYKENCAACHGDNGRNGAAISLANPVYLEIAKDHLQSIVSGGVPGKLMPPFARSAGGTLTDKQVEVIVQGVEREWGDAGAPAKSDPPPYAATLTGNAAHGLAEYATFCARCHGPNGEGGATLPASDASVSGSAKPGSIVDPSFLAILSDQNLRSIVIAGRPDQDMPDWRTDAAQPMTDQQITDIVAWIASKRVPDPGQPYPSHP